jgi:hypothetical protein
LKASSALVRAMSSVSWSGCAVARRVASQLPKVSRALALACCASLQLQAYLVEVARGLQLGGLRGRDGRAQRLRGAQVDEVVDAAHALHLRQVAHDGAAQPDEEAGEHEGHEPEAAAKPLF